jgi:hypothetical protein
VTSGKKSLLSSLVLLVGLCLAERPLHPQSTVFVDETSQRLPQIIDTSYYAQFGDIDGDGDLDILVSNSSYGGTNFPDLILLNDGAGFFSQDTSGRIPRIYTNINRMVPGDIESDGDLDVFVAVDEDWNLLLVNDGTGYFTDEGEERLPPRPLRPWRSQGAVFGDVEGDLDLDFIVVNFGNEKNLLRLNDGHGYFTSADSQFPSGQDNSSSLASADIDADFDVDVYVANDLFGDGDKLMVNDGDGFFTDVSGIQIPQDNNATNGAAFGDVDLDGDFDLVIANSFFASNRIFINRGDGYFDDRTGDLLPLVSAESVTVSFGDIDNDGDLDLLVANHASGGALNQLYINDGSGRFTDESSLYLPVEDSETDVLLLGDVDLDGDLDIFEVNHTTTGGKQNRLLINNSTPDSIPPVIPRTYQHPDTGDTTNPYLITTEAWDNTSVVIGELKVSLFYRALDETVRNQSEVGFAEVPMLDCGGFLYRERIPAQGSGKRVEYYIKAEDRMGNASYDPPSAPDSVFSFRVDASLGINGGSNGSPNLPKAFSLSQNYPNPFNPSTTIRFDVPEGHASVSVNVAVYDLRGRLVRKLVDEQKTPGRYQIHWDGRDDRGQEVSSGVYLYRITAGEFVSTRKMVMVQ